MFIRKMHTISHSSLSVFNQQCNEYQEKGYVPMDNIIVTYNPEDKKLFYTQQFFVPNDEANVEDTSDVFGNFNE